MGLFTQMTIEQKIPTIEIGAFGPGGKREGGGGPKRRERDCS